MEQYTSCKFPWKNLRSALTLAVVVDNALAVCKNWKAKRDGLGSVRGVACNLPSPVRRQEHSAPPVRQLPNPPAAQLSPALPSCQKSKATQHLAPTHKQVPSGPAVQAAAGAVRQRRRQGSAAHAGLHAFYPAQGAFRCSGCGSALWTGERVPMLCMLCTTCQVSTAHSPRASCPGCTR